MGVSSEPGHPDDATQTTGAGPPLTARVVRGTAWVFASKVVARMLALVNVVVLARLLSPGDFGLFGIVMLAMAALRTFTETGFNAALIQRKADTEAYLDTAWTAQVVRGLVLAGALFAIAPAVGWFFDEPRVVPLLRVMCVALAINEFANIGVVYFRKELEFHRQFFFDLVPAVAALIVGVVLAYRLRSVWALAWARLAGASVRCALSFRVHPFRPRLQFDRQKAAELFRYGRWLLASSTLVFLVTQGDDVVVGKMLGVIALGLYQMAFRLSNLPATLLTHSVSPVVFPAYARLQDSPARLKGAFLRTVAAVATAATPIAVGTFLLAPDAVPLLLGDKWVPIVPAVCILVVFGYARSLGAINGSLFRGTGNMRHDTVSVALKLLCLGALIYPLTRAYGIVGTAFATTVPVWVSQSYAVRHVCRITSYRLSEYLACLAAPLVGSAGMAVGVVLLRSTMPLGVARVLLCVALGAAIYVAVLMAVPAWGPHKEVVALIRKTMSEMRRRASRRFCASQQ